MAKRKGSKGGNAKQKRQISHAREGKSKKIKPSNAKLSEAVRQFVSWYRKNTDGKGDWEIDYIELGDQAFLKYKKLLKNFNEYLSKFEKDFAYIVTTPVKERNYLWSDGSGIEYIGNHAEMVRSRAAFLDSDEVFEKIGTKKYKLEKTGKFGDCSGYNQKIDTVPYLSFAYSEKKYWKKVCNKLKKEFR